MLGHAKGKIYIVCALLLLHHHILFFRQLVIIQNWLWQFIQMTSSLLSCQRFFHNIFYFKKVFLKKHIWKCNARQEKHNGLMMTVFLCLIFHFKICVHKRDFLWCLFSNRSSKGSYTETLRKEKNMIIRVSPFFFMNTRARDNMIINGDHKIPFHFLSRSLHLENYTLCASYIYFLHEWLTQAISPNVVPNDVLKKIVIFCHTFIFCMKNDSIIITLHYLMISMRNPLFSFLSKNDVNKQRRLKGYWSWQPKRNNMKPK